MLGRFWDPPNTVISLLLIDRPLEKTLAYNFCRMVELKKRQLKQAA